MNDPKVDALMPRINAWIAMPFVQAQAAIVAFMRADDVQYSPLDYELVALSVTAEEAIGLVFGV